MVFQTMRCSPPSAWVVACSLRKIFCAGSICPASACRFSSSKIPASSGRTGSRSWAVLERPRNRFPRPLRQNPEQATLKSEHACMCKSSSVVFLAGYTRPNALACTFFCGDHGEQTKALSNSVDACTYVH